MHPYFAVTSEGGAGKGRDWSSAPPGQGEQPMDQHQQHVVQQHRIDIKQGTTERNRQTDRQLKADDPG